MEDVKLNFIEKCVRNYVDDVVVAMEKSIVRNKAVSTGDLKASLNGYASEKVGKLIFKEYGRFVDMGVGKGKPLSKSLEKASKNKPLRKRKKIYSPIVYGKLNGLASDLMYGLTEQTIATIKAQLAQHASNTTI